MIQTARILLTLSFIIFFLGHVSAKGKPEYAYATIPTDLLKNADVVVRDYKVQMNVTSSNDIDITEKLVITVLNSDGYDYCRLNEYYSNFRKIKDIYATLRDKDGYELRSISKRDFHDVSSFDGVSIFNDVREKVYDFNYAQYPFTVELEMDTHLNSLFLIPDWHVQFDHNCAVEHASLEVIYPNETPVHYKLMHLDKSMSVIDTDGGKKISIAVSDIKAGKKVILAPDESFRYPAVILAADSFEYGGTSGKTSSWKDFGKFVYDLNADRDSLPTAARKKVHELTDTCKTDIGKISVLYEYLKKTTRYIAVNIDISGFQCFDAASVYSNSYGDCKGLSNYMHAMLKEINIPSYGVLIYGSDKHRNSMVEDFPSSYFNHYILCVPFKNDTVWMDCVSKTDPAGYLSDFTNNRKALMLTPDGGYVVKTPDYTCKENVLCRRVDVHFDAQDNSEISYTCSNSGYFYNREYRSVKDEPNNEIKKHFGEVISLPTSVIKNFEITDGESAHIPVLTEHVLLSGSGKVSRSGKRMIIDPEVVPMKILTVNDASHRETPFELPHSFVISDTTNITVGTGYTKEYLPEDETIEKPFGTFSYKTVYNNNEIQVIRYYKQIEGIYSADMFNDYAAFTRAATSNQKQIVLLKNE